MNEEKRMILEMLREGKITTEEAERLLEALTTEKNTTKEKFKSQYSKDTKELNLELILENLSDKLDGLSVKLGGKEGDSFSKTIGNIGVEVGSVMSDFGKDLNQTFETIITSVKDFTSSDIKGMEVVKSAVDMDISEIQSPTLDFKAVNGGIELQGLDVDKVSLNVSCTYKEKEIQEGEKLFDFYLEDERLIFSPRYSGVSIAIEGVIPKRDYDRIYMQTKNGALTLKDASVDILNLETSNGRISLRGITSDDIDLTTKNGRVELEKISANELNAQTSNGKLKLSNIDCPLMDLRTSNASVEAYSVKSNDLVLKTSNASLMADSILSEQILLYTTNGKVELSNYDEGEVKTIDLQTTNGSIKVDRAPKEKPSRYILETSMGSIDINKDRLIYSNHTHVNYGMKKIEAESTDYQANEDNAITYRAATSNGSIKIG